MKIYYSQALSVPCYPKRIDLSNSSFLENDSYHPIKHQAMVRSQPIDIPRVRSSHDYSFPSFIRNNDQSIEKTQVNNNTTNSSISPMSYWNPSPSLDILIFREAQLFDDLNCEYLWLDQEDMCLFFLEN